MKAWTLAAVDMKCGRCGDTIREGAPVLALVLASGLIKRRCVKCDGPAPPDLPALVERQPVKKEQPMQPLRVLARDWKVRQSGDREPGEDDA